MRRRCSRCVVTPSCCDRPAVAIVGPRNASANGCAFARRLGRELAAAGLVVVSGLARGIDTAAHEGALAGGGATVAVIATGVDVAYPPENAALMDADRGRGCGGRASGRLGPSPAPRTSRAATG